MRAAPIEARRILTRKNGEHLERRVDGILRTLLLRKQEQNGRRIRPFHSVMTLARRKACGPQGSVGAGQFDRQAVYGLRLTVEEWNYTGQSCELQDVANHLLRLGDGEESARRLDI